GGSRCGGATGASAAKCSTGFSVYPGIYRLGKPGYFSGLSYGALLEKNHYQGRYLWRIEFDRNCIASKARTDGSAVFGSNVLYPHTYNRNYCRSEPDNQSTG